ncbi:MAG: flagellar hook-associated 3 family protein [Methylocystaceae bacterium]|nr:MAG: flagellar hook-associated 3 family protein [Methylocystaceae bacterium]
MVYITSTPSLLNALRRSILETQTQLSKAQSEVSSGRIADLAATLGGVVAQDYALGIRGEDLQSIAQSNAVVTTRLDTTQAALSSIAETAQQFLQTLAAAQSGAGGNAAAVQDAAASGLKSLTANLDTSVAGVYVFGGINSGAPPIADYFADPPAANKEAVDQAFSSAFAVTQASSGVGSISAAQMQSFLSGPFSDLFSSANWRADWSSASDQALQNRISLGRTIDASVTANDPALQKLAMAYTMAADLGATRLSDSAYRELVKTATAAVGEAVSRLTGLQASVGLMQQNVADANQTISLQRNAIAIQIGSLENVDPYEASTRLTGLMTQIEISYNITSRIQQLTLSKYI